MPIPYIWRKCAKCMRLLEKNLTNHAKVVWMIDTTAPPPMTGNRKQTCDGTRLKPEGFNLVPQHWCQTPDQANAMVWCPTPILSAMIAAMRGAYAIGTVHDTQFGYPATARAETRAAKTLDGERYFVQLRGGCKPDTCTAPRGGLCRNQCFPRPKMRRNIYCALRGVGLIPLAHTTAPHAEDLQKRLRTVYRRLIDSPSGDDIVSPSVCGNRAVPGISVLHAGLAPGTCRGPVDPSFHDVPFDQRASGPTVNGKVRGSTAARKLRGDISKRDVAHALHRWQWCWPSSAHAEKRVVCLCPGSGKGTVGIDIHNKPFRAAVVRPRLEIKPVYPPGRRVVVGVAIGRRPSKPVRPITTAAVPIAGTRQSGATDNVVSSYCDTGDDKPSNLSGCPHVSIRKEPVSSSRFEYCCCQDSNTSG